LAETEATPTSLRDRRVGWHRSHAFGRNAIGFAGVTSFAGARQSRAIATCCCD
jgi:hypothetical protein